ncbi:hypothetical protein TB1_011756 [Malus domestica]
MKFVDWYLKIAFGSALIGASMELFMIEIGFCVRTLHFIFTLVFLSSDYAPAVFFFFYVTQLMEQYCK